MRTAYLIKQAGNKAELVTHGNVVDLKKQFLSIELKKDESLLLLGKDIRPKSRGINDMDAYFAISEKENAKFRAAAKARAEALKKKGATEPKKVSPDEIKKADAGKSDEVLKIKAEQAAKFKSQQPTQAQSKKESK